MLAARDPSTTGAGGCWEQLLLASVHVVPGLFLPVIYRHPTVD